MAYTTINKSSLHFNTVLYAGNASYGHGITGVVFQPDWVWIKRRDGSARNHELYDVVRGTDKALYSSSNGAESTGSNLLHSFDSDGFTVDDHAGINGNDNFVSWNWKAGGTGSANSNGDISSTVSANTTAGFSIVAYTGNGTGNSTIGHGLGATPTFIIVKRRDSTGNWGTYNPAFVSASDPGLLYLDTNNSKQADTNVFGTSAAFTSTTFTVGDWNGSNVNYGNYIAYCFAEKTGYSKFGSYQLNNNNDNTFIYTGFKPKFILIKNSDNVEHWYILDTERDKLNPLQNADDSFLRANTDANEDNASSGANSVAIDLLSNGFKIRTSNPASGELSFGTRNYIYMAFGQSLVGSNDIPCTAR